MVSRVHSRRTCRPLSMRRGGIPIGKSVGKMGPSSDALALLFGRRRANLSSASSSDTTFGTCCESGPASETRRTTGLAHDTHALPRLALGIDGPIIRPIPGTLIATPHGLFPADFFGASLEVQTLWRV